MQAECYAFSASARGAECFRRLLDARSASLGGMNTLSMGSGFFDSMRSESNSAARSPIRTLD